jgi:hypothetical protein
VTERKHPGALKIADLEEGARYTSGSVGEHAHTPHRPGPLTDELMANKNRGLPRRSQGSWRPASCGRLLLWRRRCKRFHIDVLCLLNLYILAMDQVHFPLQKAWSDA